MRSPLQLLLDFFDDGATASGPQATQFFRHPNANRQVRFGEVHVAYELRRARRRSIGFSVGPHGLTVTAPQWVRVGDIEAALQNKSEWIVSKLSQGRERQERIAATRIEWKDGATFPYLGEQVIVVLDPRHAFDGGGQLHVAEQTLPGVTRMTLHIGLAQTANAQQIRDAVQAWLMREAKRIFTERLDHYAPQLGVQWKKLSLSSAATLWGTARHDGSIRLNWRLIHFGLPVIDYVVAHELSHLRVMDHSPRFWDTVKSVVPQYADLRAKLKEEALPAW